jgi:hypothetical protein
MKLRALHSSSSGIPFYPVRDGEGRTHLLIHLPTEQEEEERWSLSRPDQAGFDSQAIFRNALVEE